jgi:hypothetical protein
VARDRGGGDHPVDCVDGGALRGLAGARPAVRPEARIPHAEPATEHQQQESVAVENERENPGTACSGGVPGVSRPCRWRPYFYPPGHEPSRESADAFLTRSTKTREC